MYRADPGISLPMPVGNMPKFYTFTDGLSIMSEEQNKKVPIR